MAGMLTTFPQVVIATLRVKYGLNIQTFFWVLGQESECPPQHCPCELSNSEAGKAFSSQRSLTASLILAVSFHQLKLF